VKDVLNRRGFEDRVGGEVTFYGVRDEMQPAYGHPVSFHLFFRLRPPAGTMGRMWNMRLSQPMSGHDMPMDHKMH